MKRKDNFVFLHEKALEILMVSQIGNNPVQYFNEIHLFFVRKSFATCLGLSCMHYINYIYTKFYKEYEIWVSLSCTRIFL